MHIEPEKINIFGTHFSNVDLKKAKEKIIQKNKKPASYICFPSTNTIAKAYKNKQFQHVLNSSFLTLADGKFTEFYARKKGYKNIKNVSGFDLLTELLHTDLNHYFYGADNLVLNKIRTKIEHEFPNAKVLGYKSPPFVSVEEVANNKTIRKDIQEINNLSPDIIWLGISTIKQDFLMYGNIEYLKKGIIIGVGAVFLYFAGTIKRGPYWIKKLGLRWIIRLIQEPKRLWKSTLPSLTFFVWLVVKESFSFNFKKSTKTNSNQ